MHVPCFTQTFYNNSYYSSYYKELLCQKLRKSITKLFQEFFYPATTGLPLSLLAWGSVPRGPLAILKDTMTGKAELPLNMGKSAGEYFQELKKNLKLAQDVAGSHAEEAQQSCISRCNLRASEKSFEIGLPTYCPIASDSEPGKFIFVRPPNPSWNQDFNPN